jgi:hypothetical protein
MAQTDWTFTLKDANTFLGGTSGSAFQHSTLTSPITGAGTWCRGFFASGTLNTYRYVAMLPINNSELTSSTGYEYGYGYSLRCWARVSNTIASSENGVVLSFKNQSNLSINSVVGGTSGAGAVTGYYLHLTETRLNLRCANSSSIVSYLESLSSSNNAVGYEKIITTSNLFNRWIRLRMDVYPISGAYDRITIYTASQAQENNWQEMHTVDIPREKVGGYVPWANNPNGDGAQANGKGYLGAIVYSFDNNAAAYIDQFEVYKETL